MTELDTSEIAEVLRRNDFQPCKRDVQKQLNLLLQSRPNQVRPKGHLTKTPLRLLRECRDLRASERERSRPPFTSGPGTEFSPGETNFSPGFEDADPFFLSLINNFNDSSPLDFDLESVSNPSPSSSTATGYKPEGEYKPSPEIHEIKEEPSILIYDIPEIPPPELIEEGEAFPLVTNHIPGNDSKLMPPPEINPTKTKSSPHGRGVGSIMTGKESFRSLVSFTSLKRRLHSKYSGSFLGDIKSLMDRLTISERSIGSGSRHGSVSNEVPHDIPAPIRLEHPVVLPGLFPQYCWEHINSNELRLCDDVNLPCSCGPIYRPLGQETHRTIRADVLFRIRHESVRVEDLGELDTFGNSILHIAAALGSPPNYLLSLIVKGANVKHLNNGNQTFLHVTYLNDDRLVDEFQHLLRSLVRRGFNFHQRDDNGQTPLHWLTQPSIPISTLRGIVDSLKLNAIDLPTCRDNIGCNVADQLEQKNLKPWDRAEVGFQPSPLGLDFANAYGSSRSASLDETRTTASRLDYYERQNIQTIEDLQRYELHADLLRTIVRAGEDPQFEDSDGRNGLHCLAEVLLDLPVPGLSSAEASTPAVQPAFIRRENYLHSLLGGGVDPNSYDRHGITPFMAFVAHKRDEEDEALTTRLLTLLVEGGANIHRRNRNGETALHIAVKLGRRAATKFLLAKGANVHARTSTGSGVVALGSKYSGRAIHDNVLYAQINLCICLVASAGAASEPTVLNEWGSPDFRILPDRPSTGIEPPKRRRSESMWY
jgi:ankyrin repeat protein